jgi:hypothetical protein
MSIKKIVQVSALAVIFAASGVAAQTTGSVNAVTQAYAGSVSPGVGVNLGTVTLSGVNGGGTVSSLPITITAGNGAQLNTLSNCQVYNSQGQSLTTGSNIVNTIGTGASTFTLNAPLTVNGSTGNQTLNVRCDVSSASPVGAIFTINAGSPAFSGVTTNPATTTTTTTTTTTPTTTTTGTTTGPALRINLDTAPSVPAGSQDVTIANISFGAAGTSYNVTSIPLTITAGSNGSVANLTDCKIRNATNLNGALSNATVVNNGVTTFGLTSPLFVGAGSSQMLALTCDVQPSAAVGSTFTTSLTPGNVLATNAATGAAISPLAFPAGSFGPNGLPASTSGTTIVSAIGTAPVAPGTGTDGSTPGVPNTGLGGNIALLAELVLAGLIALMGAFYLGRKQA